MPDAEDLGLRVLAGLERGRAAAIAAKRAEGAQSRALVRVALDHDILEGHGERGRAIRIARRLRGRVCQRQVYRILDALISASS